jgi:hypothetical protein
MGLLWQRSAKTRKYPQRNIAKRNGRHARPSRREDVSSYPLGQSPADIVMIIRDNQVVVVDCPAESSRASRLSNPVGPANTQPAGFDIPSGQQRISRRHLGQNPPYRHDDQPGHNNKQCADDGGTRRTVAPGMEDAEDDGLDEREDTHGQGDGPCVDEKGPTPWGAGRQRAAGVVKLARIVCLEADRGERRGVEGRAGDVVEGAGPDTDGFHGEPSVV